MSVQQLIQPNVPLLHLSDTVEDALRLMEDHDLEQLPLVHGELYVGLLEEDLLLSLNMALVLNEIPKPEGAPFIISGGHPYEALKIMQEKGLQVLPIVADDGAYIGCITLTQLAHFMATNGSLDRAGAIIVLLIEQRQYSLWELARITESEGINILTAQVQRLSEESHYQVTIKVDSNDLSGLVQAFTRHEINVKEVYGDSEMSEDLEQRYQSLMNYINM